MSQFVQKFINRLDRGTEDSAEAALCLGLLLELHTAPSVDRERTTRSIIGDSLVNRGVSAAEYEAFFQLLTAKAGNEEFLSTDAIQVLSDLRDLRIIKPLCKAIPRALGDEKTENAANNAMNAVFWLVVGAAWDREPELVAMLHEVRDHAITDSLQEQNAMRLENLEDIRKTKKRRR